jgi:hypothetical protein
MKAHYHVHNRQQVNPVHALITSRNDVMGVLGINEYCDRVPLLFSAQFKSRFWNPFLPPTASS